MQQCSVELPDDDSGASLGGDLSDSEPAGLSSDSVALPGAHHVDLPEDDDGTNPLPFLDGTVAVRKVPKIQRCIKKAKEKNTGNPPSRTAASSSRAGQVPRQLASLRDDFLELFSPPRVAAYLRGLGYRAGLSADLTTGWNFTHADTRQALRFQLAARRPRVVLTSPPCTWYSALNVLWNIPKMDPEVAARRAEHAHMLFDFAMEVLSLTAASGGGIVHEHPEKANSWKRASCLSVQQQHPLVCTVKFDQCCFGLCSPNGTPMRKRTVLMTNMSAVVATFDKRFCDRQHYHRTIQGQEAGHRISSFAQVYPPLMVEALGQAVIQHIQQQQ